MPVDEVQRAGCDRDGELVIEDFTVQLSFEHLWFPGLPQTSGQLQEERIQISSFKKVV